MDADAFSCLSCSFNQSRIFGNSCDRKESDLCGFGFGPNCRSGRHSCSRSRIRRRHEPNDSRVVFTGLHICRCRRLFDRQNAKRASPPGSLHRNLFAAATAGGILILSKVPGGVEELKHLLVGELLLVTLPAISKMAILYGSIGLFHVLFRKKFLAISLNSEAAEASGVNIRFWDVLFYMSFGVVITKSVQIVGVLLVFAYLVIPAVIAQMWYDTIRGRLLLGWVTAILASAIGIVVSAHWDYPTGPAVVVTLSLLMVESAVIYYCYRAPRKMKAAANVILWTALILLFFFCLSRLRKVEGRPAELGFQVYQIWEEGIHQVAKAKSISFAHIFFVLFLFN